jgi:hypothetical protein
MASSLRLSMMKEWSGGNLRRAAVSRVRAVNLRRSAALTEV